MYNSVLLHRLQLQKQKQMLLHRPRVLHLSPIDTPEARRNPGANAGSLFHPSRTRRSKRSSTAKCLILRAESGPEVSRRPIHPVNPGRHHFRIQYISVSNTESGTPSPAPTTFMGRLGSMIGQVFRSGDPEATGSARASQAWSL